MHFFEKEVHLIENLYSIASSSRWIKKAYRFEKCKIVFIYRWHIVYVENLQEATKRDIRSGKFSKVSGYKVNIKKSIVFLYINKPLEIEIKNTIYNSIRMWNN